MNKIQWRTMKSSDLSELLQHTQVLESRAVGSSTVYRLAMPGRELLAVSLPHGHALVVEPHFVPRMNRRKNPDPETPEGGAAGVDVAGSE